MIKLKKETIPLDEWLGIPDCPIQRDTERHAQSASKKHLSCSSPTHANVSAARLPSGEEYKLDGHTRSFLWATGKLEPPSHILYVDVYYCDNMTEVEDLYQQFDNQDAVENLRDKLYGAYRLHGFTPKSSVIKTGGVTSAIAMILGIQFNRHSIYKAVAPFIPTLMLIDKEDFPSRLFISPVLAATIVTVHKDGEQAMKFWRAYANDEGVKRGREKDGVQALTELLLSIRSAGGVFANVKRLHLAGRALSAYLSYQEGRMYTIALKATDFTKYVHEKAKITRGAKAA